MTRIRTPHSQSGWAQASSIAWSIARRLGDRLLELVGRVGVGDGATARLDMSDAVLDDDRPDVDAGIEVAGVADVADGAAVAAALDRLELVDDLHRADLRSARQGAGGQHRAQRLEGADPGAQAPVTFETMCITWL